MQMFNFDFMKNDNAKPIETVNRMMHTLNQAKHHCANLFNGRGSAINADRVQLRENGSSQVLYSWPEGD